MKNRRSTGTREILLLYRFRDTEIGRQLYAVAARMGILCRVIEEEQTQETLGALLKLPGFSASLQPSSDGAEEEAEAKKEKRELTRQAMIMHGFTRQRLDEFLKNMRKAGVPVIPLKAIVTPYNVSWTFRALYEELEKEEEAMRAEREARAVNTEQADEKLI